MNSSTIARSRSRGPFPRGAAARTRPFARWKIWRQLAALCPSVAAMPVAVLEHLAQQEHRALLRPSDSSTVRKASVTDSPRSADASGIAASSVRIGSGSQGPTYSSRVARAAFSRSRHKRVTTVRR